MVDRLHMEYMYSGSCDSSTSLSLQPSSIASSDGESTQINTQENSENCGSSFTCGLLLVLFAFYLK